MFSLTLSEAIAFDENDELAPFRQAFVMDDPELIYLDGNSLGRLPRATVALLQDMVSRQWGQRLIRSWNEGWFTLSQRSGGKLARLLERKKRYPEAVIVLRRAWKKGPAARPREVLDIKKQIARLYESAGDDRMAVREYRKLILQYPEEYIRSRRS